MEQVYSIFTIYQRWIYFWQNLRSPEKHKEIGLFLRLCLPSFPGDLTAGAEVALFYPFYCPFPSCLRVDFFSFIEGHTLLDKIIKCTWARFWSYLQSAVNLNSLQWLQGSNSGFMLLWMASEFGLYKWILKRENYHSCSHSYSLAKANLTSLGFFTELGKFCSPLIV